MIELIEYLAKVVPLLRIAWPNNALDNMYGVRLALDVWLNMVVLISVFFGFRLFFINRRQQKFRETLESLAKIQALRIYWLAVGKIADLALILNDRTLPPANIRLFRDNYSIKGLPFQQWPIIRYKLLLDHFTKIQKLHGKIKWANWAGFSEIDSKSLEPVVDLTQAIAHAASLLKEAGHDKDDPFILAFEQGERLSMELRAVSRKVVLFGRDQINGQDIGDPQDLLRLAKATGELEYLANSTLESLDLEIRAWESQMKALEAEEPVEVDLPVLDIRLVDLVDDEETEEKVEIVDINEWITYSKARDDQVPPFIGCGPILPDLSKS